ncbi:MAG: T9SS type A sorting domain-containing protein, partial [Paludibacteraceae bacterium]|nr:T9SS type A sorting domain-containing protein [Paludibacteraceae bacterium]
WIDNETVEVQNAQPNLTVSLVSISGSVLSQTKADADGKAAIVIPNKAGVYMLSTGNQSFKIIRK